MTGVLGGGYERQREAVFRLRGALQCDAQHRCRAYWAAHRERAARSERIAGSGWGCPARGIEAAAKEHLEASGWMRGHLTKAVGLHVADEVWECGGSASVRRRLGAPARTTADRLVVASSPTSPGGSRSHTKAQPYMGDVAAGWHPRRVPDDLPPPKAGANRSVCTGANAAGQPAGTPILAQPGRLPAPTNPAGLKILVRITMGRWRWCSPACPAGISCCQFDSPKARAGGRTWLHFLADPAVWHKIDLVRVRDRKAPGGWRYYAHLLTHQAGLSVPGHPSSLRS